MNLRRILITVPLGERNVATSRSLISLVLMMFLALRIEANKFISAIDTELERSIHRYKRLQNMSEVENYLQSLFEGDKRRECAFMLLDHKIVAVRKHFIASGKNEQHARMISSAISLTKNAEEKFPNIAYAFIAQAAGQSKHFPSDMPTVVIAKRDGYEMPGIMLPNPYFSSGDLLRWHQESRKLLTETGSRYSWAQRDKRVFWRGDISNHPDSCDRDDGNFARLQAVSLTVEHPELFDVRCDDCHPHNFSTPYYKAVDKNCSMKWEKSSLDPTMIQLLSKTDKMSKKIHDALYRPKDEYARYRGLLDLPGKTSGSYSRNLNDIWFLGAVIYIWEHRFVEFYYPELKVGSTHLIMNKKNALAQASILEDLSPAVIALLRGARHIAENVVCAACLAKYISTVYTKVYRHLRLDLVLDNASALSRVFKAAGVDCATDLVEIVPSKDKKFGSVMKEMSLPSSHSCESLLREYFHLS